jgi:hypothetical protein
MSALGRTRRDDGWMGYSTGKWEGDTLVVQKTGFKGEGWLDNAGHPRGQSMLITERFRRRDFGHIELEIRYEDPKYYTRPFTNKTTLNLIPDSDIIEFVCTENEKDMSTFGQAVESEPVVHPNSVHRPG